MRDVLNSMLAAPVTTASKSANATHTKLTELTVDKFIKKAHNSDNVPFKVSSTISRVSEWIDK